jgi:hypothetical protein
LRSCALIVSILKSVTVIPLLWRSSNCILYVLGDRLDALFLTQVYFGLKFCSSVLEIVGLRVPARYSRDFALFNIFSVCKNCPSARCASAANVVCRNVDVFVARRALPRLILNVV